ncbi:hypothetical protein OUZ56_029285 [Daphnia magna]|uniref:Secreted protein n=1 Tax=Daphnia magna TaxID=35525 RepID=A0ABR0B6D4_9CRUS|nr:hypothetical protein OUZ56_029285 [Daphnia magna]
MQSSAALALSLASAASATSHHPCILILSLVFRTNCYASSTFKVWSPPDKSLSPAVPIFERFSRVNRTGMRPVRNDSDRNIDTLRHLRVLDS